MVDYWHYPGLVARVESAIDCWGSFPGVPDFDRYWYGGNHLFGCRPCLDVVFCYENQIKSPSSKGRFFCCVKKLIKILDVWQVK